MQKNDLVKIFFDPLKIYLASNFSGDRHSGENRNPGNKENSAEKAMKQQYLLEKKSIDEIGYLLDFM